MNALRVCNVLGTGLRHFCKNNRRGWADATCKHAGADAHLLNLLIVCCCDIFITDRISGVVIDGEHYVELEQVHELNKQARYRKQGEAVGVDTACLSFNVQ